MSGDVLAFPQTRKALRHYASDMQAAGLLSLLLLDREGEPTPENVKRFDGLDAAPMPEQSAELLLLVLIFSALPKKKRETIKSLVRCAAHSQNANAAEVGLHKLIGEHP